MHLNGIVNSITTETIIDNRNGDIKLIDEKVQRSKVKNL
jgi:hypothetical protein